MDRPARAPLLVPEWPPARRLHLRHLRHCRAMRLCGRLHDAEQVREGVARPVRAAAVPDARFDHRADPRAPSRVRLGERVKIVQAVGWYFPEALGGTEIYVAALCR